MLTFGTGWKPDVHKRPGKLGAPAPPYSAGLPSSHLLLTQHVGRTRAAASKDPTILPTLAQLTTNRCVAFSFGAVVWCGLRATGRRPVLPDLQAVYVLAQQLGQQRLGERLPIVDEGLVPEELVGMASSWGVIPCKGPDDPILAPGRVLEERFVDEVQAAASHKIAAWRRVEDARPLRDPAAERKRIVDTAKSYLVAGYPGMVGGDITRAYGEYTGGVYHREPTDPSIGRHMNGVFGFDDRFGAFAMLNSWGEAWGTGGWCWVSYETYASAFYSDRYFLAVEEIPTFQGAA